MGAKPGRSDRHQAGAKAEVWRTRWIVWPLWYAAYTIAFGLLLQFTWLGDFWDGTELPELPWWIGGPILGAFTVPVTLPILLIGRAVWLWRVRRQDRARMAQEQTGQDRNL